MENLRSRELENKQLTDVITDVYHEFQEEYEVLVAPDGDSGIFKYIGVSPQAQYQLSKWSKKRGVQRSGLGFVIRRAELMDRFRISIDVEISEEVTGKDPEDLVGTMNTYAQSEYGVQAPVFILYLHPTYSGKRGWAEKTFVGIEIEILEKDLKVLNKVKKKVSELSKKLMHSLDYALMES